jgi:hypothetical protein
LSVAAATLSGGPAQYRTLQFRPKAQACLHPARDDR